VNFLEKFRGKVDITTSAVASSEPGGLENILFPLPPDKIRPLAFKIVIKKGKILKM